MTGRGVEAERSVFAYADVATKTSTLLALVNIARQSAKTPVNATVIYSRTRVLATKYRIMMLAIVIKDAIAVTILSTIRSVFRSSYRQIPDSGSCGTGFLKRQRIRW